MSITEHLSEYKKALLYYLYRIYPIQKNKIVFCNYNGKGYGCNPKYIAEELLKRHSDWDYVWLVKNTKEKMPKEIRIVDYNSNQSIYELATAKIWIDNQRKLWFHRKRKKQFFIETWHGAGIPMKKIGADNPNNFYNKPYQHTSKHMNKIANIMISNSKACTEIFHRAFLYDKEILNCGYPRNDILCAGKEVHKLYQQKVKAAFNIKENEHIVLYAPTYRNKRRIEQYTLDYKNVINALSRKFGGKWHLLSRLHPTMREKGNIMVNNFSEINASDYEDVQELLIASDILISDYSSIITEFGLMKKPIFLFATDIDEYKNEREFYCNYYSLPFSVAETNEQLIKNITAFSYENYFESIEQCYQKYGIQEFGNASQTIANLIEKEIYGKVYNV